MIPMDILNYRGENIPDGEFELLQALTAEQWPKEPVKSLLHPADYPASPGSTSRASFLQ